jgi:hypothetical protein
MILVFFVPAFLERKKKINNWKRKKIKGKPHVWFYWTRKFNRERESTEPLSVMYWLAGVWRDRETERDTQREREREREREWEGTVVWPAGVWRDRERERESEILERELEKGRVTRGKAGHAVVGDLTGGAVLTERERENTPWDNTRSKMGSFHIYRFFFPNI